VESAEKERLPKWKAWLFRGGTALKWFVVGCFALVSAGMALPWLAAFVEGLNDFAGHSDLAFVLIGGLIGAGIGGLVEGGRAGGATFALAITGAAVLYAANGEPTQIECHKAFEARKSLSKKQGQLIIQWGKCLVDDSPLDDAECARLSELAGDLTLPGHFNQPGAVLDRLRRRQVELTSWLQDNCYPK
jgi:hypothetical protein